MGKFALLIGVGQYGDDFQPLPSAANDVERLKTILEDKSLCNFDEVRLLINPDRENIDRSTFDLFSDKTPDDLVLFYYSGHGVKAQDGSLFFATPQTKINKEGFIKNPTAFKTNILQEYMNNCRSKYQVVILDCCFSGAFGRNYVPKSSIEINVAESLGGQGRAILTSSSSTQYSFEDKSSGLSLYTQFFIEGLEKREADYDKDGRITVDEIHRYVSQKLKENGSQITPKLYPVEQGYSIYIAKLSQDAPVIYASKLGCILVGNVVDFSDFREMDQRRIFDKLWDFILRHRLLNNHVECATDGALDRFIIAWAGGLYQEVIDFACSLIEDMSNFKPSAGLKIGIHQGLFEKIKRPSDNTNHLIGYGPNECIRIARIGDAGSIILSSAFVKSWENQKGLEIYQNLEPSNPNEPIEFFPKPDFSQHIFIYKRAQTSNGQDAVPMSLATLDVVGKLLQNEILPEIGETFIELLQGYDESLKWSKVRPRISILAPDYRNNTLLRSTNFRFIKPEESDDFTEGRDRRGSTIYKLNGKGEGPAGRCFNSKPPKPYVLHKLPSFKRSPTKYIQCFEGLDLPEETIRGFSRHARAFTTFPFRLSENGDPEGVVCIDTYSDLGNISKDDLRTIGYVLMNTYSLLIAALWKLRV